MASKQENSEVPEPMPCSPCRGTGQVISNLGGSPSTVACPWCEGTGTFIPGHDAQEHQRAQPAQDPQDEPPAAA